MSSVVVLRSVRAGRCEVGVLESTMEGPWKDHIADINLRVQGIAGWSGCSCLGVGWPSEQKLVRGDEGVTGLGNDGLVVVRMLARMGSRDCFRWARSWMS